MGMSIGGVASGVATASWQNRRQDLASLVSSIRNGALAGAQQAFAALSGSGSSTSTSSGSASVSATPASATGSGNPFADGLAAIGQALESGDISGAQQALGKMFADHAGGHHRHHGGSASASASSTVSATTPPISPGSTVSILV
jgi:hypothetical protein